MRRVIIGVVIAVSAIVGPLAAVATGGGEHPTPGWTTCGPAADQYGCTTTTQTTTTQTTTTAPPGTPCPITPENPDGSLPDHPGGQDGNPGNDICTPDTPPETTTVTTQPPPETTTPPVTEPPVTTTTEPPVTTTVSENPPTVVVKPKPDEMPGVRVHGEACKAPAYMLKGECVRNFKGTPHPISRGSG